MAKHKTQEQIERDIAAFKAMKGFRAMVKPLMEADKVKELHRHGMHVTKPEGHIITIVKKWFA